MSICNRRTLLVSGAAFLASGWKSARADAQQPQLELNLLFDVSQSALQPYTKSGGVWQRHFDDQINGHLRALRDSTITSQLLSTRCIVRPVFWSSTVRGMSVPFSPIFMQSERDVARFCVLLDSARQMFEPREGVTSTEHFRAIQFTVDVLPALADRRVIDIVTDEEVSYSQTDLTLTEKLNAESRAVQINVLGVALPEKSTTNFKKFLATSDGFVLATQDWNDFDRAIKEKLGTELIG